MSFRINKAIQPTRSRRTRRGSKSRHGGWGSSAAAAFLLLGLWASSSSPRAAPRLLVASFSGAAVVKQFSSSSNSYYLSSRTGGSPFVRSRRRRHSFSLSFSPEPYASSFGSEDARSSLDPTTTARRRGASAPRRRPPTVSLFATRQQSGPRQQPPPPRVDEEALIRGVSDDNDDAELYEVVYQKVVRPPPSSRRSENAALFLGELVEHLSDRYALPDKLPMVYEAVGAPKAYDDDVADEELLEDMTLADDTAQEEGSRRRRQRTMSPDDAVVSWDSKLSPDPDATRLDVHVVGIYPSEDDAIPTWAMVAVRKRKQHQQKQQLPVLLQNLFADSEKQILRHLDRTLQDVESGRISIAAGHGQRDAQRKSSFRQAQEDMVDDFVMLSDQERELLMKSPPGGAAPAKAGNAMDAQVIEPSSNKNSVRAATNLKEETFVPSAAATTDHGASTAAATAADNSRVSGGAKNVERRESAPLSTTARKGAASGSASKGSPGLDYAIQAARSAAARRQQRLMELQQQQQQPRNPTGTVLQQDFAVEAARRASNARASKPSERRRSQATDESPPSETAGPDLELDVRSIRPPILDPDNLSKRSFTATISRPQDYSKTRAVKKATDEKLLSKVAAPESQQQERRRVASASSAGVVGEPTSGLDPVDAKDRPTAAASKRQLNVVVEQSDGDSAAPPALRRDEDAHDAAFADDEQMLATNQVLDELASGEGSDLTAEELLRSVMAFGDGQDEQDPPEGRGFADGAFDAAREMLREQSLKRQQRLQEPSSTAPLQEPRFKEVLGPDEEIRRMFEAGERIAEGRLAVATSAGSLSEPSAWSAADEQLVDSLVEKEKSVSGHARVLDDELTELELQIYKSPEERQDASRRTNPMFDILSGPEVYNPNVDPETAVNWPGALPGTRKAFNAPRELEEAIKQAQFAASVLSNLEERPKQRGGANAAPSTAVEFYVGDRELTREQVQNLQLVVKEAVETGLIEDPLLVVSERSRLQMLLDELRYQPEERFREIASSYKDLLLSDRFVQLVKERMNAMAERDIEALRTDDDSLDEAHARERAMLGTLVGYAQLLLKEARALGAELEAQHLEVIRSICKVAMDPRYSTQEDTALALTDAVRNMRPLFDDSFVAYLKFAVAEEEGRLARAGLLDDPDHNQWLLVLRIVQQGVYKELERGVSRYIDHIWYVLRMETPTERRLLLKSIVDVMPTMDVRPFVQVVENVVGSLGDSATGDFDGAATLGEMTNKLLQLRRDVRELLPPERIALMSRDADEWAAAQKKRLVEQRRQTQQLLEGARKTEHLDDELDALGRRGEVERIE